MKKAKRKQTVINRKWGLLAKKRVVVVDNKQGIDFTESVNPNECVFQLFAINYVD